METGDQTVADARSQIATVIDALAESWNRHDMKAYAAQFAGDADFVNVIGMHWHGRAEIEARHIAVHRTIFRNSRLQTLEHSVRFLAPGVAVAHVLWEMTGHQAVPGMNMPEIRRGILTCVFKEEGDRWLIAASQNTDIIPVQLPTGNE
jgi:uncharacterized protein (TIGR02246 family)